MLDRSFLMPDHFYIEEDYSWIEELGTHKAEYLPNLNKIKITEHSSYSMPGPEHNLFRTKWWDVPKSMREMFQTENVELFVVVRSTYSLGLDREDDESFHFIPSPKRLLE
jgi:hypothetical protein